MLQLQIFSMKPLASILYYARNKYILATVFFIVWIFFFDHNDLITQMERVNELHKMEQSKAYFSKQIEENRKFSNDLEFNAATIEKFAREKYLMKRENEDLFLIKPLEKK